MSIPFNKPTFIGNELNYINNAIESNKISGDGLFTKKCHTWFEEKLNSKVLLTTSCTHALEMIAILLNIGSGDEVIMPSYTFVSTANAFAIRGAKIVFVDIRPDTMNIDETKIEKAITTKTKVIVPVHYAGVSCEMDVIMDIANKYNLFVVEDAAQGMMATYKGKHLGTIGHFGAYSFHETKNYTSGGEGGLLIINDSRFYDRAEIIREKGTNRSKFFRGMVDKYSWVDIGSSYLPSDINAAYLYAQLEQAQNINFDRLNKWKFYYDELSLVNNKLIALPEKHAIYIKHNAHMFYIKLLNLDVRTALIEYLKKHHIQSAFHYVPLHSSIAGSNFSVFNGQDVYTTSESDRLLRLPIYYNISYSEILQVVEVIKKFVEKYE